MQIAHVLSSFDLGGQERVALDLAVEQRKHGNAVLAVSLASGPDGVLASRFRDAGIAALSVRKRGGFDPTLPFRLAVCLARERVTVVHTHNPQALVYGAPAGRLAGAVVLHSKHGINPDPPRRRALRRAAASLVDAYVAVTPSLAELALHANECDAGCLYVVSNGIHVDAFAPNPVHRRSARAELGIPNDAWVVGTVGRLVPEKDHASLLRAIGPELGKQQRLVVVGTGTELPKLFALLRELRIESWVHLTGARPDISRFLAAFDVFAQSSQTEGLPLALLEACASGLPVVATSVGGVPDLIEHGVNGVLVSAGDVDGLRAALRALADDRVRAATLGSAARERVRARYSVQRMASEYERLYRDSIANRRLLRARAHVGALP